MGSPTPKVWIILYFTYAPHFVCPIHSSMVILNMNWKLLLWTLECTYPSRTLLSVFWVCTKCIQSTTAHHQLTLGLIFWQILILFSTASWPPLNVCYLLVALVLFCLSSHSFIQSSIHSFIHPFIWFWGTEFLSVTMAVLEFKSWPQT